MDSDCYSPSGYGFFGNTNFCASGHVQLCKLFCVIQNDMLNVIILKHNYFVLLMVFSSSASLVEAISCNRVWFFCDFIFLMWLLLQILHPTIEPFIFRVQGYMYPLLEPGQLLCVRFISITGTSGRCTDAS